MKCPTITIIFLTFLFSSCSTLKTSRPFESLDFKNHKWQIVYVEDKCDPITYNWIQNIWMLNDNNIIDSLRYQYKCDLKKQCDGEKEYHIFSFKDHWHNDWNLFCNQNYFSLGKLKPYLVLVTTTYFDCQNLYATKVLVDSLNKNEVSFTITPIDSITETLNEFAIILDLGINISSKLLENNDTLFTTWTPKAINELKRLFPEFIIEDASFQPNKHLDIDAPGFALSNSKKEQYYFKNKQLRFVLTSNGPIKLDLSRLESTDLFMDYYVRPMYLVTTYTRK
jgi:hypothetical protein